MIDSLPESKEVEKKRPGVKKYSEELILKALRIMIIRRLYSTYALLSFLEQDDPGIKQVRVLLTEKGEFPSRKTWERRLAKLICSLPDLIGLLADIWFIYLKFGKKEWK